MRRLIPSAAALLVFFGLLFVLATGAALAGKMNTSHSAQMDILDTGYTPRMGAAAPSSSAAGSHT